MKADGEASEPLPMRPGDPRKIDSEYVCVKLRRLYPDVGRHRCERNERRERKAAER